MTVSEFMAHLHRLGVDLRAEGEQVRYSAPKDALTVALRSEMASRKREILQFLRETNGTTRPSPPPLLGAPRNRDLPLSFAQQRIWFMDQFEPGNPAYNIPLAVRLMGSLNITALERSLNEIVRRHESLRTTCAIVSGEPVQVIAPIPTLRLPVVDMREKGERRDQVLRLATEEARRIFDLTKGPLLRATLLRLSKEEHVLLLTTHHFVADGWSMRVFMRELSAFYEAFSTGKPSSLPDLPIQYADFAQWQRQRLQGKVLEEELAYWKKQLAGTPLVLELPTDRPRPTVQSYRGAGQSIQLPKYLSERLKELSRLEGVTLFMTLLATLKVLLHRYTGQTDMVVGTAVSNRNRIETEGLIGPFANNLVLRTDLSGNPTFRGLLDRIREVAGEAYAHQDLPFEKLLEELRPERALSHTPLFQVMFILHQDSLEQKLRLPYLTLNRVRLELGSARFDLMLSMEDHAEGLSGSLEYSTDLFDPATIDRLLGHYHTLLQAIAADPRRPISALPLLTQAERNQLSTRRNPVAPSNPFAEFKREEVDQSLPSRFEQVVKAYPHRMSVQSGRYQWSYEELNRRANQAARAILRSCGRGEERVALLFDDDAPMIGAILGVLKAGNTYVPLDPAYPKERLAYLLEDSQAKAIVTNSKNTALARTQTNGSLELINIDDVEDSASADNPNLRISPDSLAYILYTSGSTGQPKGVMQSHRNVLHHIRVYTNALHIQSEDRLTLLSSYSFDAAVMDIFGALLNGASLYPLDLTEKESSALIARMIQEKISIYHSTPTVYRYLMGSLTGKENLSAIRIVVLGGEEVQKKDVDLFRRHSSSRSIFVNGLGPTESTVALQYFMRHETEMTANSVAVGFPVEDTEVLLLNEAGENGEIYGEIGIRSAHVALGYWRKPELTKAAFLRDPESETKCLYRTGDMGRLLPDGAIRFIGRKDFQVKIRGFRIDLGEIEAVLAQHPGILEAVVVAREEVENPKSAGKRLVVYAVPQQTPAPAAGELRDFLKQKLPHYMVPSTFVFLDALPVTPNGKVDRRALPPPDSSRPELEEAFVAPRTPNEQTLAAIWAEVLKLEKIGIHDNFFDLGGHSLLATQVISRVKKTFQADIQLRALFESPTVAGLSELIVQKQAEALGEEDLAQLLAEAQADGRQV